MVNAYGLIGDYVLVEGYDLWAVNVEIKISCGCSYCNLMFNVTSKIDYK